MPRRHEDLTGRKFGRWTVLGNYRTVGRQPYWRCLCECGTERDCQRSSLMDGRSQSCGCLHRELIGKLFTTHGDTINRADTKERIAWKDAKGRCHTPSHRWYRFYGAKGVSMCVKWRDNYAAFLADMGRAPEGTSLDRIDPTGNYEPGNCRWADKRTQSLNTRKGVTLIDVDGIGFTAKELGRAYGVDPKALRRRLDLGEEPKEAIRRIQANRINRRYPARP